MIYRRLVLCPTNKHADARAIFSLSKADTTLGRNILEKDE